MRGKGGDIGPTDPVRCPISSMISKKKPDSKRDVKFIIASTKELYLENHWIGFYFRIFSNKLKLYRAD